jgi:hypothetical protein
MGEEDMGHQEAVMDLQEVDHQGEDMEGHIEVEWTNHCRPVQQVEWQQELWCEVVEADRPRDMEHHRMAEEVIEAHLQEAVMPEDLHLLKPRAMTRQPILRLCPLQLTSMPHTTQMIAVPVFQEPNLHHLYQR